MTTTAPKKTTARQLPAILALATDCGLDYSKCDSKTHEFAPVSVRGDYLGLVGLSCEDNERMARFAELVRAHLFGYDAWVQERGRFVVVTWAKDTRTQAQLDNVD